MSTTVSHFLENPATLSSGSYHEWLNFDDVTVFMNATQLRDLHAKITARLAEIDGAVAKIEGQQAQPAVELAEKVREEWEA